jgi:hypothetical protein
MRHISNRHAQRRRTRDELRRRNYLPEVCPRCHRERVVDTHELVRRSQYAAAAAELELMTPVGRECHDWIMTHPGAAVDEGWALWRWQLADAEAIRAAEWRRLEASVFAWARQTTDSACHTITDMPGMISFRGLSDATLAEIDELAAAEHRSRSNTLVMLIEEALDARQNIGPPPRDPVGEMPLVGRGINPVTGRPYGPVPK